MSSLPLIRFMDRRTPPHIFTLILLAGVSSLTVNIFLPSLPHMADYFGTSYALMQLSLVLYLAATAALQLVIGPISDNLGRRPVVLGGVALFILATLGCIFAPNVTVFLVMRVCQAVIVSALVLSRAIVRDMVPGEEAASLIGYVTMAMSVIPMAAPALGGLLDETLGWQASFAALALAGVFLLVLSWFDLGETARPSKVSLLAQFREYPELLRSRRFWGYAMITAFSAGSFFAFLGGAPLVASQTFGLSPSVMGLYLGFPAVGYLIGNFFAGRYSVRAGINRMIMIGTWILIAGMTIPAVLFALGATHPLAFFGFMASVGIGNGMVLPNAISGSLSVRPHLAGTASGLGGAIMMGGGAGLSAIAGAVLRPEWGVYPLLALMMATALLSVASILYVRRVNRLAGELTGMVDPGPHL